MNDSKIHVDYATWLNTMDWDVFGTFTTKYAMSVPAARRSMERLYSNLKTTNERVRLFWVAEPFDSRQGYHTHGLVYTGNLPEANNLQLIKAWQIVSKGGGGKKFNRAILKRYEKDLGANFYVSKYMLRKNADYDFLYESA